MDLFLSQVGMKLSLTNNGSIFEEKHHLHHGQQLDSDLPGKRDLHVLSLEQPMWHTQIALFWEVGRGTVLAKFSVERNRSEPSAV